MRLWSLNPLYLDSQGLVALGREALLARAVLRGQTRGYRSHPQLERFRAHPAPVWAIDTYLLGVYVEALARGYSFDSGKFDPVPEQPPIAVSSGQIAYEWQHLLSKLAARSPALHERWRSESAPRCHPLFRPFAGPVADWERQPTAAR